MFHLGFYFVFRFCFVSSSSSISFYPLYMLTNFKNVRNFKVRVPCILKEKISIRNFDEIIYWPNIKQKPQNTKQRILRHNTEHQAHTHPAMYVVSWMKVLFKKNLGYSYVGPWCCCRDNSRVVPTADVWYFLIRRLIDYIWWMILRFNYSEPVIIIHIAFDIA